MGTGQPYTILSVSQGTISDNQLRLVRTTQVKYMVGEDGPFTYLAPPDQQGAEQIRTALLLAAKNILALRGT